MALGKTVETAREAIAGMQDGVRRTTQKVAAVVQTVDTARHWYFESGTAEQDKVAIQESAQRLLRRIIKQ